MNLLELQQHIERAVNACHQQNIDPRTINVIVRESSHSSVYNYRLKHEDFGLYTDSQIFVIKTPLI